MKKDKIMKISIAVAIAMILSIGTAMAQQMQGKNTKDQIESQFHFCLQNQDDPRDVLCPVLTDVAPLIRDMIQRGIYGEIYDGAGEGKGDSDPENTTVPPEQIEIRLTHLETEWCPNNIPGDWGNGPFDFHLLTALASCAFLFMFAAGVPYIIAAWVSANILMGIGIYGIVTMALIEFGLDYSEQIIDAYWHCVEILTGEPL